MFDRSAMKKFFEIAMAAVQREDQLLRGHCACACGYHHGIGHVEERTFMHLILRALIKSRFKYKVRLEQPYPNDPSSKADLVLLREGQQQWAACVEAKLLDSHETMNLARQDMQWMRDRLLPDVGKFLLAFWARRNLDDVCRWLVELNNEPNVDLVSTDTFVTSWCVEEEGNFTLQPVDAGLTLFEVL